MPSALPIRAEDRVALQLILPADTVRRIDKMAAEEMLSRSAFLRRLIVMTARAPVEA
jgi:ribbon-helix-helix CopG family protein